MNTTETKVEHRCCALVHRAGLGSGFFKSCGKRARVCREGGWFCGVHDPARKQAKQDEKYAALEADRERKANAHKRTSDCVNACAGIADPQSAIAAAREALKDSVKAAEYVVRLIEQTGKAGVSPNPMEKADWLGAAMHCYAAMSFIQKARQALERLG
jgi:hypothetical protein